MDLLMGVDIGSTTVKAVVYTPEGNHVSHASARLPLTHDNAGHPTWCVWRHEDVWNCVKSVVSESVGKLGASDKVRALAVTGFGMDGLPIDRAGGELYPLISWHCPRTIEQFEEVKGIIGEEEMFRETLKRGMTIDTIYRILWMRKYEPRILEQADKWLLIEDYVNYKLCGEVATDYSMASTVSAMRQETHTWSDMILSRLGIPRSLLPTPRQSGTPLAPVRESLRAETKLGDDTLVVLGGHDYICAAFAAGVMSGDKMLDINGTWEMLVGVMDDIGRLEFSEDIFYIESHVARNAYCTIESSISGDMLEWAKNVLHGSWDELGNEAAASPAGSRGCAFLPHFSGSIAPREEPASLGAFVGMSNNVTRGDMFHAVMEGLSFKTREMYDSICKAAGNSIEHFKAVGGAAANTQWMQMKADILGIPVEIPDIYEATSLGAALLAGIGSGIYASEEEALSAVSKREDLYEPDPQKHEAYRDLYENIYLKLQDALGGVNKGIFDRFIK